MSSADHPPPAASDYEIIVAMVARMKEAADGRVVPEDEDRWYGDAPVPEGEGFVLRIEGGYLDFYTRLRFDREGRLVSWGSYE